MEPGTIVLLVVAALIVALLVTNIRIVPQATAYVIERLGKYHATWEAGLHVKVPLIDQIVKIMTLKEQVLDTPPQPVIISTSKPCKTWLSMMLRVPKAIDSKSAR